MYFVPERDWKIRIFFRDFGSKNAKLKVVELLT